MAAAGAMTITVGELLARVLAVHGVDGVYGDPLPGAEVTRAPAPIAPLLAGAHRRVHRRQAAAHAAGVLTIGAGSTERVIRDGAELLQPFPVDVTLRIDVDVFAGAPDRVPPTPAHADAWGEADPGALARLAGAAA